MDSLEFRSIRMTLCLGGTEQEGEEDKKNDEERDEEFSCEIILALLICMNEEFCKRCWPDPPATIAGVSVVSTEVLRCFFVSCMIYAMAFYSNIRLEQV
jgi:hypothetical protein